MKMKKEYIFLTVIIVVLLLYIGLKNTDRTHYSLPELKQIEKEDIDKVMISKGDGTITLSRSSGEWKILPEKYKADSKKVDQILDEFKNFTVTTLVSEAETYQRYGLGNDERIYARAFDSELALRQFYIGKAASTRRHSYVKFTGDPKVYEARNNLRRIFDKSLDDLRDKTVLTFEGTGVSSIVLAPQGSDELALEKTRVPLPVEPAQEEGEEKARQMEEKWVTSDGREGKSESIKSLIRTISNLKCAGFVEGKSKEDFTQPIFTLTALVHNETHFISIFEKDEDDRYPAASSESSYPFFLSEWKAKQIMKTPEELLVEEGSE